MHSWIQFYSNQYIAFANYLDQLFLDYDRIQLEQLYLSEPFKLDVIQRFGGQKKQLSVEEERELEEDKNVSQQERHYEEQID